jgi:hypothetical protein
MTGRKIAKHAPKVTDITERRRETVELDRFIATHGGVVPRCGGVLPRPRPPNHPHHPLTDRLELLDAGLKLAAPPVLSVEGVQLRQQAHGREPTAGAGHRENQRVASRRRQPSPSTVQSLCFTFNHRAVRPPSYGLVLGHRGPRSRAIIGETSEISLTFESDVGPRPPRAASRRRGRRGGRVCRCRPPR